MADGNEETAMDVACQVDANIEEKLRREGKLRSVAWQHFTKLTKEDGTYEKCRCIHCNKVFACSSRSGTTNLLRHLTDGGCPVVKLDKKEKTPTSAKGAPLPWKYDQAPIELSFDTHDVLLPEGLPYAHSNGDFVGQTSNPKQPSGKSDEVKACLGKLNKLINEQLPKGTSLKTSLVIGCPDTSIFTAIKCLNEMEDIPESSAMYLDALDILRDPEERECFVCLNPEPRRRWLQRMLHRHHPLNYNSNI